MKSFKCLCFGDSLLNNVTKNYAQGFDVDINKTETGRASTIML